MRRLPIAVPLLFALGCVPSVNPFYLPEDAVSPEILLGEWIDVGCKRRCRLEKGEGNTIVPRGDADFRGPAQLFRLGDHYFLDVPADSGLEAAPANLHSVYKVSLVGDQLRCWALTPEWLADLLKKEPKAIGHRPGWTDPYKILLTAPSKDLRDFLVKHSDDLYAFSYGKYLTAATPTPISAEGLGSRKQRTLEYWYGLRRLVAVPPDACRAGIDPFDHVRGLASALETERDDKGVDAEAVACRKEAAVTFRALEKYFDPLEGRHVPLKWIDAFAQEVGANPIGAAKELVEDKKLTEQIGKTIEHLEQARATLSKRHGAKLMPIR
jgi:hypothetical protein